MIKWKYTKDLTLENMPKFGIPLLLFSEKECNHRINTWDNCSIGSIDRIDNEGFRFVSDAGSLFSPNRVIKYIPLEELLNIEMK